MASYDFSIDYTTGTSLPHADTLSRNCLTADEASEVIATIQRDENLVEAAKYDPILDEAILAKEQENDEELPRNTLHLENNSETSPIVKEKIRVPTKIEGIPLALIRDLKVEFWAISKDRQRFLKLTKHDLSQDLSEPFVVCRPATAIRVRPSTSCSYKLLFNSLNTTSCEGQLLYHTEPQFLRLGQKGIWFNISPYPLPFVRAVSSKRSRNTQYLRDPRTRPKVFRFTVHPSPL